MQNKSDLTPLPSVLAIDTFFEDTTFDPVLQPDDVEAGDYDFNSDVITTLNPDQAYQTYAIASNSNTDLAIDLWKGIRLLLIIKSGFCLKDCGLPNLVLINISIVKYLSRWFQ